MRPNSRDRKRLAVDLRGQHEFLFAEDPRGSSLLVRTRTSDGKRELGYLDTNRQFVPSDQPPAREPDDPTSDRIVVDQDESQQPRVRLHNPEVVLHHSGLDTSRRKMTGRRAAKKKSKTR